MTKKKTAARTRTTSTEPELSAVERAARRRTITNQDRNPAAESSHSTARFADAPEDNTAGDVPKGRIRVRALETIYYDDARRRQGDVFFLHDREGTFTEPVLDKAGEPKVDKQGNAIVKEVYKVLTAEDQFSPRSMERVDASTRLKTSTGRDVIRRKHDEIISGQITKPMQVGPDDVPDDASNPLGVN